VDRRDKARESSIRYRKIEKTRFVNRAFIKREKQQAYWTDKRTLIEEEVEEKNESVVVDWITILSSRIASFSLQQLLPPGCVPR
jgi:hypothetical protein